MTLSIAVLGCGAVAHTHAETLARVAPEVRLAFASRDAGRAESYRRRHRGFAAFGTYSSAIADSRVSAVLIATPPAQHLSLALEALEAGKQVVVEKPAFLRAADVDQVEALTRKTGRQVLVAENYRYKPLTAVLLRLIDSGAIGTPRLIRLTALKHQPASDWRGTPALAGGGALFEGGIHWVNLLAMLGGDIAEVHGFRPSGGAEPERTMVVVTRFANGAVGTLHHSWEAPARLRGLSLSQIVGERGSVAFESNGLFVAVNAAKRRLFFPGFRDIRGFRAMWKDFVSAFRTGAPSVMTLADARRDLAVVEAAYRTATQG
ncbi:MAG: Gfo/Idh/MocA family protein [Gemmatimonadales bacterium]